MADRLPDAQVVAGDVVTRTASGGSLWLTLFRPPGPRSSRSTQADLEGRRQRPSGRMTQAVGIRLRWPWTASSSLDARGGVSTCHRPTSPPDTEPKLCFLTCF